MPAGKQEKSQKYIDLSTFNKNLSDSNPRSSLGVMNFQKWELFLAHPVDIRQGFGLLLSGANGPGSGFPICLAICL